MTNGGGKHDDTKKPVKKKKPKKATRKTPAKTFAEEALRPKKPQG
jgi:hypothetical protein